MTTRETPRVAMVQDGARLHYALPLALHQAGMLERVFLDWGTAPSLLARGIARALRPLRPALATRFAARRCDRLPADRIVASLPVSLLLWGGRRCFRRRVDYFAWESRQRGRWIRRQGLGDANTLLGFVRNIDPMLCAWARREGIRTIADQMIAPAEIELRQACIERERWPGWEAEGGSEDLQEVIAIERETWAELDQITCASEYVRDGLAEVGVARQRVHVLPYPIDAAALPVPVRPARHPVTIGLVGQVSLRKGAPYFLEVARRLASTGARFVMIGGLSLRPEVLARECGAVEIVGPVPRSDIHSWLEKLDVFFFPSTCEGSAGVVMEAMASGLPVVTSHHAGTVARDGMEGFVSDHDDIDRHVACLARLINDEELRREMGRAARRRAEEFSIATYAEGLVGMLGTVDERF